MAVIYQENFSSVANETLLNNVAGWTVTAQYPLTRDSLVVNNGAIETRRTETAAAYYNTQSDNYYVETKVFANTSDSFATYLGCAVRVSDYDNMIRSLIWDGGIRILSVVAGVQTVIQFITNVEVFSGDTHRLEVENDQLTFLVNGVQQGTVMDITGILSSQNAGVYCGSSRLPAFDDFEVGNFTSDTITISDVEDREIINVTGATHDYTLSGTYTGAITPTAIQYRVEEFVNNTTVTDWTTLDASPSAGSYSGVITVPKGPYYRIMVRYSNDTSIVASSSRIGFGMLFEFAGQSNIDNLFSDYVPSSVSDNIAFHDGTSWALPSRGEFVEGLNKLATDNNCVVGCFNTAIAASNIETHISGGSNYSTRVAALTAIGGKLSGILWGQGEANTSATKADYKAKLATLRADILTRTGQPSSDVPMFIVQLGRNATQSGNDSGWSNIREAQTEFASETTDVYISHQTMDLPMTDTFHRTTSGYLQEMQRFADTYDYVVNSNAPSGLGAVLLSASYSGDDVTLTFNLNGATQLTAPSSATSLYELSVDNFSSSVSPTSVTVSGVDKLILSFASVPTGSLTLRSHYGQDFTVADFPTSDLSYESQDVMVAPLISPITVDAEVVETDTTKPVINLTPSALTYNLSVDDSFTLPTATLTDDTDNTRSISPSSNNVNMASAGSYSVVYSGYTDDAGNVADTVTVNVVVSAVENEPALNLVMTNIPNGPHYTRVINTETDLIIYSGNLTWTDGTASIADLGLSAGVAVDYYIVEGVTYGLGQGVTE